MKRLLMAAGAAAFAAGGAHAGGVERSTQSTAILFEKGTYVELSFGRGMPDVSGTQAVAAGPGSPAGAKSGDMAGDFTTTALSFKTAINDRFDLALVLDQPIGADVDYKAGTGYLYGGSTASLDSSAVTVMGRYKLNGGFSVVGGLRAQSVEGKVALFSGYSLDTSRETDFGYLVGMAYEKPEIALRVALTYNSSITHDFAASEADPLNGPASTSFKTEVPQSLNLEFQTGIAKDTLLFGSVRWVDWTAFDISPVNYVGLYTDPLVSYHDDTITYNVGVGRRFNDTWSAAITLGYEPSVGGFAGNLGPTDGFTSIGLAGTYTRGRMKITGGVRYAMIGDAKTKTPAVLPYPPGTTFGKFKDNHALGFGLKVGYSF